MSSETISFLRRFRNLRDRRQPWLASDQGSCLLSLILACLLLCLGQLQLAQSAKATDSAPQPRASGAVRAYAAFRTHGTNGFRIYVTGSPKGVRLMASKRHEAAIYLDRRGFANQDGMRASFGRLGKIHLRFHPLHKARRTLGQPANWTGCQLKLKDKYGYFTGIVAFRGEEGFTKLRQRNIYGRAAPAQRLKCIEESSRSAPDIPLKVTLDQQRQFSTGISIPIRSSFIALRSLIAGGEAISGIRSLVRSGVPLNLAKLPSTGVPFRAESIQEYGRLAVIRLLVAKGSKRSFVVDSNQNVTVMPPTPFSGEAEYRRCAPRSTLQWRGSVRVSLPGLSNAAFAGKGFTASLKPGGRCQPAE
jgi:hypothetical protein